MVASDPVTQTMRIQMTKALATAAVFAVVFLVGSGAAQANSALDQYVEQVPTPGGSKNVANEPPTKRLDPKVEEKLREKGEEGAQLGQVASVTAPPSATPSSESYEVDGKEGSKSGKHKKKRKTESGAGAKDEGAESKGGGLDVLKEEPTPGTAESLGEAASTSGVNSLLAAVVIGLAIAMGALALRRRLGGDRV